MDHIIGGRPATTQRHRPKPESGGKRTSGHALSTPRFAAQTAAAAGCALSAVVLLPEHLLGTEVVPESLDTFLDLGMTFGIAVLLLRRPTTTRAVVGPSFARGALLGLLVVAVVGSVAALGTLWIDGGAVAAFAGTAVLGLCITPLRAFVRRRADGVLFGGTHGPYEVLSALGRRVEGAGPPDEVLGEVVRTVAEELHLPFVAIEVDTEGTPTRVATVGLACDADLHFPFTHGGELQGHLVVGIPDGQQLTGADRRLLQDLSHQIGPVARAAQLVTELRLANRRMTAARADERRRLRRDLHDELGPLLAGIGLATQAARNLLGTDQQAATSLLERAAEDTKYATTEVRRLLEDLHPLLLDQVGLVGALNRKLARLPSAPHTEIVTIGELGQLPADVELAAYRIAVEAHTNVVRHAGASQCRVEIERADDLVLRVLDDGRGFRKSDSPGIGLRSMTERATALGGTCRVRKRPDSGTMVEATLPLDRA